MANFTPSGKVRIGRVPFDNSYRHTMTFPSVEAQTAFFSSCCTQAFEKDTYTYIRMNNSIRVQFNAEALYTYDYVMYQNANYGNKWFYAFIVGVNYINENTTELVLELDVMQTWYFDYTLVQGFVEREHVNDDTVGAHLNAEPSMDLQYVYDDIVYHTWDIDNCFIVMLVNAYPHWNVSQTDVSGSDPQSGGMYQNQYNACKALLYKGWDSDSMARFKEDMEAFNKAGAAETICDAYTVPASAVDATKLVTLRVKIGDVVQDRTNVFTLNDGSIPVSVGANIARPYTIDGYTPRNNKLLCYPYCYLELGDFTGRTEDLRWEYFTLDGDTAKMVDRKAGISDCQGYVIPVDYDGDTEGDGLESWKNFKPFTYDFNNKISWVFSAYQTWAAQNAVTNQLAVIGSVGAMMMGAASGIGAGVKAFGAGAGAMSNLEAAGVSTKAARLSWANYANQKAAEGANPYPIAAGLGGIGSYLGQLERMRRTPNTARGNTSGNSKLQNGHAGWYAGKVAIRREFAEIVDGFLDMFGYQVDSVKVPNREGRASWNYIKMQNSCHRGAVPSDQMSKINQIYDAGITFWHTSDVGNYSLPNGIVS